MSSRYYLPLRHDVIAKYFYEAIRRKKDPKCKIEYKGNEFIDQDNGLNIGGMLLLKQL